MMRAVYGRDPLDDPLVAAWDAIVLDDQKTPFEVDPADVALLRHLGTLDEPATLSSTFFQDLEARLTGVSPAPVAPRSWTMPVVAPTVAASTSAKERRRSIPASIGPSLTRARSFQWLGRKHSMQGALAVLAVMMVASLLVLYQAAPRPAEPPLIPAAVIAQPAIEPITQFEFAPPMWDMPEATDWGRMETGLLSVAPATSFTTDVGFYTSVDGPFLLTVLSGELTVTPAGSALFYPANHSGQPPVEVSAGSDVSIGPNDTLVYSSSDAASGSNWGSDPALVLYGLVGIIDHSVPGSGVDPTDVSFITFDYADPLALMPTKGATVTLQRLELAPFDAFVFEPDADSWFVPLLDPVQREGLHIAEGALEGLAPQTDARQIYGAVQFRHLPPGPHTIFNLGDKTVSIYFLVVEPLPDGGVPPA